MTKRPIISVSTILPAVLFLSVATYAQGLDNSAKPEVKVDNSSFKCITDMTPVRHFYVDNLKENLAGTVAVAQAGKGEYPEGSVVQLIPNEVMIKQQKGFNAATHDWEFIYIDIDKNGSKIFSRGATKTNNRLGLNCFACHSQARSEFDMICEQNHGCAPIPITREMFRALQRTDPRCKHEGPPSPEDQAALKQLDQVVQALKVMHHEPASK